MTTKKPIAKSPSAPSYLRVQKVDVGGFQNNDVRSFEYLDRKDSVGVLIYHTDKEVFTWVKQFRIGQATKDGGTGIDYTIEPVAGMIDEGQTPEEAAMREVEEEVGITGHKYSRWTSISSFLMCPGISNERMHLFLCEVEGQPLNVSGGLPGEEDIEVLHWSSGQTEQAFYRGEMANAQAMILWQWVCLNRPSLVYERPLLSAEFEM